jgi:hypothetical protein
MLNSSNGAVDISRTRYYNSFLNKEIQFIGSDDGASPSTRLLDMGPTHAIALCIPCIILVNCGHLYICERSRVAEDENPSRASPTNVRRSTSVKWWGYT